MINIFEDFRGYLLKIEKSENTIEAYNKDIEMFFRWYKKDIDFFSENFSRSALKKYLNYLEQNFAIKTINRRTASLNRFIEFLNNEYDKKIALRVKPLKIETQNFIDDMLENKHVRKFVRLAKLEDDIRAVTIFYALYYTGARVSEMLQLKTKDILKDSISVKGKGSKYRQLLIPKKLKEQFKIYSKARYETTSFLFSGQRGSISRQEVHNEIKKYATKSRLIDTSIAHAHAFRHLYAQNLTGMGVNPVIISQLLGHTLTVTGLYIQVSKKDLLKIINRLDLKRNIRRTV